MIVEYLRYTVPAERADEFVSAYARASEPLLASPHCTGFDLARCVEDPTRFILRIEWTSAEDHLEKFRGSEEFERFFSHVKPFVEEIDEMRHYEPLLEKKG